MSVNFFDENYREYTAEQIFGIWDNQKNTPACFSPLQCEKWIAKVNNERKFTLAFIAVDYKIIIQKENDVGKESTCDAMLLFDNSIYLIELKDKDSRYLEYAKQQLTNTINLMKKYNKGDLKNLSCKKAFVCNKKYHKMTNATYREMKHAFFKDTNFTLDVKSNIDIK